MKIRDIDQLIEVAARVFAQKGFDQTRIEDIATELAFEVVYFNLSEYHKGGALLSCMVMHLNRFSYRFDLT